VPYRATSAAVDQVRAVRAEPHRVNRTAAAVGDADSPQVGGGRYVQLPRRTLVRAPVATFHNVTALSAPPLARIVPSGLSATE